MPPKTGLCPHASILAEGRPILSEPRNRHRLGTMASPDRDVSAASARRIWAACRTPCSKIVRPSATKRSERETSSIARARSAGVRRPSEPR